jgi:predicted O-methyltransferase YrrM
VDFNESEALRLLREVFATYRAEYERFPSTAEAAGAGFYLHNGYFESVDAEVLYCLVRATRPRQVLEVGSGFSTLVARQALDANGSGTIAAVDPEPRATISAAVDEHIATRVQDLPPAYFERLQEGDILFVDSSHVVSAGGDVNYLFFDVFPRLKRGVLVHVHDIFLPLEYPPRWVAAGNTEQHLLLAFLSFNTVFQVMWPGALMAERYPSELAQTFPSFHAGVHPGSFWMKRSA